MGNRRFGRGRSALEQSRAELKQSTAQHTQKRKKEPLSTSAVNWRLTYCTHPHGNGKQCIDEILFWFPKGGSEM